MRPSTNWTALAGLGGTARPGEAEEDGVVSKRGRQGEPPSGPPPRPRPGASAPLGCYSGAATAARASVSRALARCERPRDVARAGGGAGGQRAMGDGARQPLLRAAAAPGPRQGRRSHG